MDESEIVPNWHVFFSIVGREIEEKVPFNPLILTPPAKIVDNCLPLQFHKKYFCIHVPDIISKLKNNKVASRNKMLIKFHIPRWTVNKVITNNVPEKARNMFLCSLQINIKKARQMQFSTAGYVCSTQTRAVFNAAVVRTHTLQFRYS